MQSVALLGAACTLLALVGYGLGLVAAYPGRALTLPGVMVGVTLLVIGLARGDES